MAIGVRDITNLEELLEVQDDDKIIVIQNGEAKLVSKANAKFGGGTVTVFYGETTPTSPKVVRLLDINGNPISAQVAYDAVMSGNVYIAVKKNNIDMFLIPIIFGALKTDAEIDSTVFICKDITDKSVQFYAGDNPGGGNA